MLAFFSWIVSFQLKKKCASVLFCRRRMHRATLTSLSRTHRATSLHRENAAKSTLECTPIANRRASCTFVSQVDLERTLSSQSKKASAIWRCEMRTMALMPITRSLRSSTAASAHRLNADAILCRVIRATALASMRRWYPRSLVRLSHTVKYRRWSLRCIASRNRSAFFTPESHSPFSVRRRSSSSLVKSIHA